MAYDLSKLSDEELDALIAETAPSPAPATQFQAPNKPLSEYTDAELEAQIAATAPNESSAGGTPTITTPTFVGGDRNIQQRPGYDPDNIGRAQSYITAEDAKAMPAMNGAERAALQSGLDSYESDGSIANWGKNIINTFSGNTTGGWFLAAARKNNGDILRGTTIRDGKKVSFMNLPDEELDYAANSAGWGSTSQVIKSLFGARAKNDLLDYWDRTEGAKIPDRRARKAARIKYAQSIAKTNIEQEQSERLTKETELEHRPKEWSSGLTSGLYTNLSYMTPFFAPGMGPVLAGLIEGGKRADELSSDVYDVDADGTVYVSAERDTRGDALRKGVIRGVTAPVIEKLGGKIVKGAFKGTLGRIPLVAKTGERIGATRAGKAVGNWMSMMSKFGEKTGLHSMPEEFVEEFLDQVMDAATGAALRESEKGYTTALGRGAGAAIDFLSPQNLVEVGESMLLLQLLGGGAASILQRKESKNREAEARRRENLGKRLDDYIARVAGIDPVELSGYTLEDKEAAVRAHMTNMSEEDIVHIFDKGANAIKKLVATLETGRQNLQDFTKEALASMDAGRGDAVPAAEGGFRYTKDDILTAEQAGESTPFLTPDKADSVEPGAVVELPDGTRLKRNKRGISKWGVVGAAKNSIALADESAGVLLSQGFRVVEGNVKAPSMTQGAVQEEANETRNGTDETQVQPAETVVVEPAKGEAARPVEAGEATPEVGRKVAATQTAVEAPASAPAETDTTTPPTSTESAETPPRASDEGRWGYLPKTERPRPFDLKEAQAALTKRLESTPGTQRAELEEELAKKNAMLESGNISKRLNKRRALRAEVQVMEEYLAALGAQQTTAQTTTTPNVPDAEVNEAEEMEVLPSFMAPEAEEAQTTEAIPEPASPEPTPTKRLKNAQGVDPTAATTPTDATEAVETPSAGSEAAPATDATPASNRLKTADGVDPLAETKDTLNAGKKKRGRPKMAGVASLEAETKRNILKAKAIYDRVKSEAPDLALSPLAFRHSKKYNPNGLTSGQLKNILLIDDTSREVLASEGMANEQIDELISVLKIAKREQDAISPNRLEKTTETGQVDYARGAQMAIDKLRRKPNDFAALVNAWKRVTEASEAAARLKQEDRKIQWDEYLPELVTKINSLSPNDQKKFAAAIRARESKLDRADTQKQISRDAGTFEGKGNSVDTKVEEEVNILGESKEAEKEKEVEVAGRKEAMDRQTVEKAPTSDRQGGVGATSDTGRGRLRLETKGGKVNVVLRNDMGDVVKRIPIDVFRAATANDPAGKAILEKLEKGETLTRKSHLMPAETQEERALRFALDEDYQKWLGKANDSEPMREKYERRQIRIAERLARNFLGGIKGVKVLDRDFIESEDTDASLRRAIAPMEGAGKKFREEARRLIMKHRGEDARALSSPEFDWVDASISEIEKFKTPKARKAALWWYCKSNLNFPADAYKVEDALAALENAKQIPRDQLNGRSLDPMAYKGPSEAIEAFNENLKNSVAYQDAAKIREFSNPKDMGHGVTVYDVEDTRAGQLAVRRFMNYCYGNDFLGPWCLLRGDGKGGLDQNAWYYWNDVYNALPKKIAIRDGKPIAFMATNGGSFTEQDLYDENVQQYFREQNPELAKKYDSGTEQPVVGGFARWMEFHYREEFIETADRYAESKVREEWWDMYDHSTKGGAIPLGNTQVPGDKFNRWADMVLRNGKIEPSTGEIILFQKRDSDGMIVSEWYHNGRIAKEETEEESKGWFSGGELGLYQTKNRNINIQYEYGHSSHGDKDTQRPSVIKVSSLSRQGSTFSNDSWEIRGDGTWIVKLPSFSDNAEEGVFQFLDDAEKVVLIQKGIKGDRSIDNIISVVFGTNETIFFDVENNTLSLSSLSSDVAPSLVERARKIAYDAMAEKDRIEGDAMEIYEKYDQRNLRYLRNPDTGRVVGTWNRKTNEITLFRGANAKTLLHELGGHAAYQYAQEQAAQGNDALLRKMDEVIDYALTNPVFKDFVADIRSRYPDASREVLRDEIWAALREHNSPAMEAAIKTLQGKAWYNRAWQAIKEAFKAILTKMGFNKTDLRGIDKMKPEEFLSFLDREMADGRRLGELAGVDLGDDGKSPVRKLFVGEIGMQAFGQSADVAREMEASGQATRREIWEQTGWWRGKDGLWRFEILDPNPMRLSQENVDNLRNLVKKNGFAQMSLANMKGVEELLATHPDISDMKIVILSRNDEQIEGVAGFYNPNTDNVAISDSQLDDLEELNNTLIHEIQHAIQEREGFSRGGNIETGKKIVIDEHRKALKAMQKQIRKLEKKGALTKEDKDDLAFWKEAKKTVSQFISNVSNGNPSQLDKEILQEQAYKYYKEILGEAESRLVEARRKMTLEERLAVPPWEMYDVSEDMLYVPNDKGGVNQSIIGPRGATRMGISNLGQAEQMEKDGANRLSIWRKTGWWQGKDGKWRVEIPDIEDFFNGKSYDEDINVLNNPMGFNLTRALGPNHWLLKAYPELRDAIVYTGVKLKKGYFGMAGVTDPTGTGVKLPYIAISRNVPKERMLSAFVHELQHLIQSQEGTAQGAVISKSIRRNKYRHISGEVEARNTQRRLEMTPEERASIPPWETEDVAEADQIVLDNNDGVSASISGIFTGSPHDYANRSRQGGVDDGPRLIKIGTGEGAYAYGWGLYGSNRKGIGEWYAQGITQRKMDKWIYDSQPHTFLGDKKLPELGIHMLHAPTEQLAEAWLGELYNRSGGDKGRLKDLLENQSVSFIESAERNFRSKESPQIVKQGRDLSKWMQKYAENIDSFFNDLSIKKEEYDKPREYLYEQTFFTNRAKGDESHLLNWYEPVSEANLSRIVNQINKELPSRNLVAKKDGIELNSSVQSGKRIFKAIPNGMAAYKFACAMASAIDGYKSGSSERLGSELLARADIDGVKYPVNSYGKAIKDGDKVGWNYVSFRDDNIRVDHKWVDGEMRYAATGTTTADRFMDDVQSRKEALEEKLVDSLAPVKAVQKKIDEHARARGDEGVKEVTNADGSTDWRNSTDFVAAKDKENGHLERKLRDLKSRFVDPAMQTLARAVLPQQSNEDLVSDFNLYLQCKHAAARNRKVANDRDDTYTPDYAEGMGRIDLGKAGFSALRGRGVVGLSENVATEILAEMQAKYGSGKFQNFEDAAQIVYQMLDADLDNRLESGLMKAEDWSSYKARRVGPMGWDTYIPLKDDLQKTEPEAYSTFKTRLTRNEFMKAKGRGSNDIAESPFAAAILQAEQGIRRSSRNVLANVEANLATKYNGGYAKGGFPDYSKTERVDNADPNSQPVYAEIVPGVDVRRTGTDYTFTFADGDKVSASGGASLVANRPDIHLFKRDGELYAIRYVTGANGRGMVVARSFSGENMGSWGRGMEWLPKVTHWLSAMRTQYSPEFTVSNMLSDNLEAVQALIGRYGIWDGFKAFGKAVAYQKRNAKDLVHYLRTGEARGKVKDAIDAGLLTKGGVASQGIDAETVAIRNDIGKYIRKQKAWSDMSAADWAKSIGRNVVDAISTANEFAEYSTRIGLVSALEEYGVPRNEAVTFARDATVNFNRKGTAMPYINGLYMFANAAVQGSMRSLRSFREDLSDSPNPHRGRLGGNKRKGELISLLVAVGVAKAVIDHFLGDDDEREREGGRNAANQTEYDRKHNVGVPIGGGRQIVPLRFRGPYAAIPYLAQTFTRMGLGDIAPTDAAQIVISELGDQTTELIGGNGIINDRGEFDTSLVMQSMAPTLMDPFVQMATGKDYKGDNRLRKSFDKTKPMSSNAKRNTPWMYKTLAEVLNSVSGGNENRIGKLDFAPENIQLIAEFLGGAPLRDVNNLYSTAVNFGQIARGGTPERTLSQMPFVRRFVREYPEVTERYYDAVEMYERDKAEFKKETRLEVRRDLRKDKPYLSSGKTQLDNMIEQVKDLTHLENGEVKRGQKWVVPKVERSEEQKEAFRKRRLKLQAKVLKRLGG